MQSERETAADQIKVLTAEVARLREGQAGFLAQVADLRRMVARLAKACGAPGDIQKALGVPERSEFWDQRNKPAGK